MTSARTKPRRLPCDVIPDAERTALHEAAAAAERRSHLSRTVRTRRRAPRLHIIDPELATWLINDGRAERIGTHGARLLLTTTQLPGLNAVAIRDAIVLGAYVTAFAKVLTAAGYHPRVEET